MKKSCVCLAAAGIFTVCASAAFAYPSSNVNSVTSYLIEDDFIEAMDNGDLGEGKKGIIFTGFSSSYVFTAGAGYWLNDNLWGGLYYSGNLSGYDNVSKSVTKDAVSSDGTTIDYTDVSSSTTESNSLSGDTELSAIVYLKNSGIGGELYWSGYNYNNTAVPTVTKDSALVTGSSTTTGTETVNGSSDTETDFNVKSHHNYYHSNQVGVNFTNFNMTSGNLFLHLDNAYVNVNKTKKDVKASTERTKNGSTVGAGSQVSYDGVLLSSSIKPYVEGTIEFPAVKAGSMSVGFSLIDGLSATVNREKSNTNYTTVTEDSYSVVTSASTYNVKYGANFSLADTLKPRADLSFEPTDKLTVKARGQVSLSGSFSKNNGDVTSTKDVTSNYDKSAQTTTSSETYAETAGQDYTYASLSVTPSVKAGLVYKVVPGKVNLNLGTSLTASSLSWYMYKYTNTGADQKSYTKNTAADGTVTTLSESSTKQGNGVSESAYSSSSFGNSYSYISLGTSIFLSDNVCLDVSLYNSSSFGLGSILNDTSSMSVDFIFKF